MSLLKKPLLAPLTSLRFFAALAILVHHCNGVFWPAADLGPLDVGVSFFFVLSGFILTYVHRDLPLERSSLRNFYCARIARIWPLHLLCLLATIVFVQIPEPFNPWVLAANASLLHAWIPFDRYFFSYNYVSWSISTELAFYLAFPFLLTYARRWHFRILLPALAIVVALIFWSYSAALPMWDTAHDHLSSTGLLYSNPLARFAEFLVGMAIAFLFLSRQSQRSTSHRYGTIIEMVIVGLFIVAYRYFLLSFAPLVHEVMLSAGATHVPLVRITAEAALLSQISPLARLAIDEWVNHVGLTPFAALAIYIFALQRGAISRWLASPIMVFLGEISFALYLVHQLILRVMQQQQIALTWVSFVAYVAAVVIAAAALHLLVERPLRRWFVGSLSVQSAK